jgi:hypothetical protein
MMKRLGKWRRTCHLLAPALLCLGLVLPVGDALAQDAPSHNAPSPIAQSIAHNDSATPEIRIWRTITLGTRKGVDAYREALDAAGIKIGDSADEILGRPSFSYARMETQVELALISVAELGVEADAASRSDVYRRAKQIGLELCLAEVGPRLRLDYRNQPLGEVLDIAMEP